MHPVTYLFRVNPIYTNTRPDKHHTTHDQKNTTNEAAEDARASLSCSGGGRCGNGVLFTWKKRNMSQKKKKKKRQKKKKKKKPQHWRTRKQYTTHVARPKPTVRNAPLGPPRTTNR